MAVGKPSAAPTIAWSLSGTTHTLKVTSAVASGAKVYIYEYRYKSPGGSYNAWSDSAWPFGKMDGRVVSHTVTRGYTYQYRTRGGSGGANGVGWGEVGAFSDVRTFTVPTIPDAPPKVTIGTPSGITLGATWTAAAANGSAITGYITKIRYALTIDKETKNVSAATRSVTFDGLSPGVSYQIGVAATNAVGTGPYTWSDSVAIGTAPAPILVVDFARNGVASWSPPVSNGGAILEYQLEIWDGFNWGGVLSNGVKTTYTVADRRPGIAYKVRVRGRNIIGTAGWRESNFATSQRCTCTV